MDAEFLFVHHLGMLREAVGLRELAPDARGRCALVIEERLWIDIACNRTAEAIVLSAELGRAAEDRQAAAYEQLLTASLFPEALDVVWSLTHGEHVRACAAIALRDLDTVGLDRVVARFIEIVDSRRDRLVNRAVTDEPLLVNYIRV